MKYLKSYYSIFESRLKMYSTYKNFTDSGSTRIYEFLKDLYQFDNFFKAGMAFTSHIPERHFPDLNFGDDTTSIEILDSYIASDITIKVTICKNIEGKYIIRIHFTEMRPILLPPTVCFIIFTGKLFNINKFKESLPKGQWSKEVIRHDLLVTRLKNMRKR